MNYDVCESHHHGNPESVEAFSSLIPHLPDLRRKVLLAVEILGDATVKEVVQLTRLPRLTVGARLTELKQMGLLAPTDARRDDCRVLGLTDLGRKTMRAN